MKDITITAEKLLPFCIFIIISTQLYDYFVNGFFNIGLITMVFFLLPMSIKGVKPQYSNTKSYKYFTIVCLILGLTLFGIEISDNF